MQLTLFSSVMGIIFICSTAIDQTTTLARVKESFRKSGMYPVDRSIIPNSQLAPADFNKSEKTNKETTDVDTTTITNNGKLFISFDLLY